MYYCDSARDEWLNWIRANLKNLKPGKKLRAPDYLSHPEEVGFDYIELAEPAGQVEDYALSLDDGSRIHVHVHADGELVVHRDTFDPKQGFFSTVAHVLTESTIGKVAVAALAVGGAVAFVKSLENE